MIPTPFTDIRRLTRASAMKGLRCHLEPEHTQALVTHPRVQALLAELEAEETARWLAAQAPPTEDSPLLPLSAPAPQFQMTQTAPPPPARSPSALPMIASGSNGEPTGGSITSLGMTAPLVQDAASQQASEQARESIRLAQHMKRLQRGLPPASAPPRRSQRPKLVSAAS